MCVQNDVKDSINWVWNGNTYKVDLDFVILIWRLLVPSLIQLFISQQPNNFSATSYLLFILYEHSQ